MTSKKKRKMDMKAPVATADEKCSFCGKKRQEAFLLLRGPGVFICAECVDSFKTKLEQEGIGTPSIWSQP